MSFLETPRCPDDVAYGFIGGPSFNTGIVTVLSGAEMRNANWSAARGSWTASYRNKTQAQTNALITHFRAVLGRMHGFRMKDWADFSASGSEGIVTLISGATYQLKKRYTTGALTHDRIITKPLATIVVEGTGSYTLATATGIITVVSGAAPTGWSGDFDVPVRFDSDELQIEAVTRSSGLLFTWGNAQIVEIRV